MVEAQIIELYVARDERAIDETISKYGNLCFRIAQNILHNNEDSEECVNETYLSLWNTIPPTRPSNFSAFICKITRNVSLRRLEQLGAQKRSANAVVYLSELEDSLADNLFVSMIDDIGFGEVLSNFLYSEKEVARNVFLRRYWFFDSVSEIARQYSFSESKVKSMLFHTRNRLREYLRKEGIIV